MRGFTLPTVLSSLALAAATSPTYDYIVVGGGTAGIIAATRLAETSKSILLLERGAAQTFNVNSSAVTVPFNNTVTPIDVPAYGYLLQTTTNGADFCTDTASNAGCVLGGGGSVNALMFVHPRSVDFSNWPEGWRWEDGVADAADRLYERDPGSNLPSADGQRYDYEPGVFSIFGSFLAENGWREVDAIEQPEDKDQIYAYPPWSIKDSVRAGPARTYLPRVLNQTNFELRLHTKALRVVRNGTFATGVEIEAQDGTREIISARNVVLAAGAMSSPRMLFNSGIGPAAQIQKVANGTTGITLPPRADWLELPVGLGLRDHPIFYINLNLTADYFGHNLTVYDPLNPTAEEVALYNDLGSGPLAQGPQRLNFWTTRNNTADGIARSFQATVVAEKPNVIQLKIYLTHGLTSEGVLGITSDGKTEFTTWPWLTAAEDKAAVLSFLNETIALLGTNVEAGAWRLADWLSGEEVTNAETLLNSYTAGAHFVGTTGLGSVVDLDARVVGMENLFVVDAGIHPEVPTGNTNAMTMVVAEHAVSKIVALTA